MKPPAASLSCLIALCLAVCGPIRAHAQTAAPAGSTAEHAHVATAPSTSLTVTVDGNGVVDIYDATLLIPLLPVGTHCS